MAAPQAESDVVYESVSRPAPGGGLDAPVRIEVAMPRDLFDRLTDHDDAPRCRYDEITGLAEFVAEPGVAHEGPAWAIGDLVSCVRYVLAEHGRHVGWQATGALRLLSDDGAFEADASFYFDAAAARALRDRGIAGYVDVRTGLAPPDLVVEIDRSRRSRHKLAPYFRMGVKERGLRIGRTASSSGRPMQTRPWLPVGSGQRGPPGVDRCRSRSALHERRPAGAGPACPARRAPGRRANRRSLAATVDPTGAD